MNLVAQGEPFDARLRCFQTAARTKLIQYRGNFAAKKKNIDTQSCSPQRWRCDYHHALPWVVYTQGAVSASAACAPLPKKTQTTTYENKIIKEAGTHW